MIKNTFYLLPLFCVALVVSTPLCAEGVDSCKDALPSAAKKVIETKLDGWKVVTFMDLRPDDQRIWKDKFKKNCPGIIAGRFSPNRPVSYAVTLIRVRNHTLRQMLVLLGGTKQDYQLIILDPARKTVAASIVKKLPPGKYSNSDQSAQVQTDFEAISYEAIEAGSIMFYWSQGRYKKLLSSE